MSEDLSKLNPEPEKEATQTPLAKQAAEETVETPAVEETPVAKEAAEETPVAKEAVEETPVAEEAAEENAEDIEVPDAPEPIEEPAEIESVDYSTFSIDQLVSRLGMLIEERPVQEIREKTDQIKVNFYKKLRAGADEKKKKFIEEGGSEEDYKPEPDPREAVVKDLLNRYRSKKKIQNKLLEEEKQLNLEEKYKIIEGIKGLVNKEESINKTFHEFREYQQRWRAVGLVPQNKLKDLWETYHYHVEKFYNYIKINEELRDLDLRKNMEIKMQLCEKAEALLLTDDSVNNFRILQKYHEQWREIGPVHEEVKESLWERFKAATSKINKRHQEYYEELKNSLKENLAKKTVLCEDVEGLTETRCTSHREWVKKSQKVIEIQKKWKGIGFAPKKDNTEIYERFRKACDAFFDMKREFYAENKEMQQNNLQIKTDLCVQAEALQDSEDWKKTTDTLIALQKKWKEVGPVSRKHSDQVWKRFRASCDHFFNRKSEYYSNIDQKYDENLKAKQELIGKIETYEFGEDQDKSFKDLKEFQRQWAEIGFVPIKKKDEINQQYRKVIDAFFGKLKIDEGDKQMYRYKSKLENLKTDGRGRDKMYNERDKTIGKLRQLENDIKLWENNIGFFAKSKSSEAMLKEFEKKIEQARENMALLEQKIRMIDKMNDK